ncbi:MAG: efflux RND transporter periplasmic adaptor subunit, partial [Lentisphaeria bacterium]
MYNGHVLGTAALALFVFFAGLGSGHGAPAPGATAPANAKPATATVTRTSLWQIVRAPARIAAGDEIEVKGKIGGQIIELPVDVGDTVKKGDLL